MKYEDTERGAGVFGHINKNLYKTRDALHEKLFSALQTNTTEILDPNVELRLDTIRGDAEVLGYILHDEKDRGQAARAAYRGIAFAHMVLEEFSPEDFLTPLDEYWETSIGQEQAWLEEKVITDSQSYIYEHEEVNDLLAFYMFELSGQSGYEHMVEIGAALTFRQAEIDAAMNEILPAYQVQLTKL